MDSSQEDLTFRFASYFTSISASELLLLQILKCYINPIFSLLGLSTNALGMAIIRRSGLEKPSNILLIGLAMADSMCMFSTINIPEILLFFDSRKKYSSLAGWQYDQNTAFALYLLRSLFYFIGDWGAYVNTTIPVVITLERLIALFYPMSFRKCITVKFAVYSVVLSFAFWLSWTVFYECLIPFDYVRISNDTQMGIWKLSDYYNSHTDVIVLFNTYIFDCLSSWVPVGFVCVGCLVIWIKVKITLANRRKLSATQNSVKISTRTTKTLVATCLVFASTHILYSIVMYIYDPEFFLYERGFVAFEAMHLIYLFNNSSSFFVYVAINNKLWKIFIHMIHATGISKSLNRLDSVKPSYGVSAF